MLPKFNINCRQGIESQWNSIKWHLKKRKGIVGDKQHHLNEWMFRKEFLDGKPFANQFSTICKVMNKWWHKC